MTRVNAGICPSKLHQLHLLAEWREITMVPAALRRRLRSLAPDKIRKRISRQFTLNQGHVVFFYDKMTFLMARFDLIAQEMRRRGYQPDMSRREAFYGFHHTWYNNWYPTEIDNNIVAERIALRISEKPHLYEI